ncbi:hypothetical protein A2U01_0086046 [Trifolium medium]|uniref:Uncharacterized protein n=1 Tax=Trifolium medium TaxID=97028 RepID=A0A392TV55_9FABA|nr:hypothetical protein [Trifolium medium]
MDGFVWPRTEVCQCFWWQCFGAASVALGLGGFGGGMPPTGYWFCLDSAQKGVG